MRYNAFTIAVSSKRDDYWLDKENEEETGIIVTVVE